MAQSYESQEFNDTNYQREAGTCVEPFQGKSFKIDRNFNMSISLASTAMPIPARQSVNKQQDFMNFLDDKEETVKKAIQNDSKNEKKEKRRNIRNYFAKK